MPGAPREVDHTLAAVERIEHHRKAAKELLRAARDGQSDALSRLRDALREVPGELRLADAQRAIAREHGHPSWAAFRRDLEHQAGEPVRSVARLGPVDPERFEQGATRLLRMLASGDQRALSRFRTHVPRLAGFDDAALSQRATVADARLVIAREYGFPSWRRLLAGLRQETAAWLRSRQHTEPVAAALAAIHAGDAGTLRRLLCSHPELVHVDVGAGGSLLGEVAQPDVFGNRLGHALGVDRECVDVLIESGSDLDGPLNIASCFDRVELVGILLAAGARVAATGVHGITPLESAIYHGSRAAADMLAAVALVPDAPWVAAGTGRVDRLERFLDGRGTASRGLPASPQPRGHRLASPPARTRCRSGRLGRGACARRPERPNRGRCLASPTGPIPTPARTKLGEFHLAAAFGALESVRLLIAGGAEIDRTNDFNGDDASRWAEYVLARERPGDSGVAAVRDLLRGLGSRPAVWAHSHGSGTFPDFANPRRSSIVPRAFLHDDQLAGVLRITIRLTIFPSRTVKSLVRISSSGRLVLSYSPSSARGRSCRRSARSPGDLQRDLVADHLVGDPAADRVCAPELAVGVVDECVVRERGNDRVFALPR